VVIHAANDLFRKLYPLTDGELVHYCGIERTTCRSFFIKPINVKSNLVLWRWYGDSVETSWSRL